MSFSQMFVLYFVTLAIFAGIDMLWWGVLARRFYRRQLESLLRAKFNIIPAVIFYLLFSIGLMVFAIVPAVDNGSLAQAAGLGVLFALFAYGTYALSNLAAIRDWPLIVTVVDVVWGMILSGIVSLVAYNIGQVVH